MKYRVFIDVGDVQTCLYITGKKKHVEMVGAALRHHLEEEQEVPTRMSTGSGRDIVIAEVIPTPPPSTQSTCPGCGKELETSSVSDEYRGTYCGCCGHMHAAPGEVS